MTQDVNPQKKKKCPHCGNEHRSTAKVCPVTGKRMEPWAEKKEQGEGVFHCPFCGEAINGKKTAKFCNKCGKPILSREKHPAVLFKENNQIQGEKSPLPFSTQLQLIKPDLSEKPHPPDQPSSLTNKSGGNAVIKVEKRFPPVSSHQCPYPSCQGIIGEKKRFCTACYQRVIPCPLCGGLNKSGETKCQSCKRVLPEEWGNWLEFKGNGERNGNSLDTITPPLDVKWTYPDKKDQAKIFSSPVIYRGMVFYGSTDSQLHALNQFNGEVIWKRPTKDIIVSTPAIWEDNIYVASVDGTIYAQKTVNGKPLWVYGGKDKQSPGKISAHLLAGEEGVFAVSETGTVLCLEPLTGKLLWGKNLEGQTITSAPAIINHRLFVALESGWVICLDAKNGENLWHFPSQKPVESRFVATPALGAGNCYIPDRSGKFYCLKETTGEDLWLGTIDLGGVIEGSPSLGYGKVIIGTLDEYLIALNLHAGGELWRVRNEKLRIMDSIFATAVTTRNRLVFVGSDSGYIYCRSLESGEEVWKKKLDSPIRSSPAVSDGFLYVTTSGGFLYALEENSQ